VERSRRRILTTHVGSLPRPPVLSDLLVRQDRGEAIDELALAAEAERAVTEAVRRQLEVGIDVGNDGEQPRAGFSTYVVRRMRGFGGESARATALDLIDFPDYAAMLAQRRRGAARIANAPQAIGPVEYADLGEAERECDLFMRAVAGQTGRFVEPFMSAASPGVIATILLDAHYGDHARYARALAREMAREYRLVVERGFVLQLDAPDLAMERARFFGRASLERFLEAVALHVDAINEALQGLPADRVRLHVCWGNYDGPHTHDVPLETILPLLYRARVGGLSIELANPRHAHEWKVFRRLPLPGGMLLLPGVVDSTTNFVEHPEVVADRIVQAVEAVGDRERVIASVDCGFGTFAGSEAVAPSVVWAKLRALREGADLATARLWGRAPRD
jgi:5-methyltetrahydropteroyltriglutamate--homocysteine methyltransferase